VACPAGVEEEDITIRVVTEVERDQGEAMKGMVNTTGISITDMNLIEDPEVLKGLCLLLQYTLVEGLRLQQGTPLTRLQATVTTCAPWQPILPLPLPIPTLATHIMLSTRHTILHPPGIMTSHHCQQTTGLAGRTTGIGVMIDLLMSSSDGLLIGREKENVIVDIEDSLLLHFKSQIKYYLKLHRYPSSASVVSKYQMLAFHAINLIYTLLL